MKDEENQNLPRVVASSFDVHRPRFIVRTSAVGDGFGQAIEIRH
jgi:hypothetical protein